MDQSAANAARFLKSFAHEGRLRILCHLATGEKSVSELETLLDARQAAVSQMLARLREDQMVETRRSGKTVYYSVSDKTVAQIIGVLYDRFCATEADGDVAIEE
ncbi:ArsR/SmtB family transcription factor [Cognatishimia sp.]|uniref:ArsR/SmtB family transcription factor n=1 Tax=Cognatishimia sp. TaxID=2211648 RepID=UPI0035131C69|nr:helix-turn-helix transcriptional regulator [Cognatishimia sp.]